MIFFSSLTKAALKPGVCSSGFVPVLNKTVITSNGSNIVSSAQFYVFLGVVAFLYSLGMIVVYVFFKHKYDNSIYLPLIVNEVFFFFQLLINYNKKNLLKDFVVTVIFTICWFSSDIAWAKAISDIQVTTNIDNLTANISPQCKSYTYASYGSLIISCVRIMKKF